jgi:hypothetical protein
MAHYAAQRSDRAGVNLMQIVAALCPPAGFAGSLDRRSKRLAFAGGDSLRNTKVSAAKRPARWQRCGVGTRFALTDGAFVRATPLPKTRLSQT